MSYTSFLIAGLGGLLLIAVPPAVPVAAQQPTDSLQTEALRDYHGSDLTGKDGPLAKAGLDLLVLYHEYRAFQQREGDTFSPSVASSHVTDGHVTVDAIAATDAKQLREDLTALGLTNAATAGRVVSGRLPIDQVPAMAKLESLRGVVLSRMQTDGDDPPTETSPKTPGNRATMVPNEAASGEKQAGETAPEKKPHDGMLIFLLGALGILLLTEL